MFEIGDRDDFIYSEENINLRLQELLANLKKNLSPGFYYITYDVLGNVSIEKESFPKNESEVIFGFRKIDFYSDFEKLPLNVKIAILKKLNPEKISQEQK